MPHAMLMCPKKGGSLFKKGRGDVWWAKLLCGLLEFFDSMPLAGFAHIKQLFWCEVLLRFKQ